VSLYRNLQQVVKVMPAVIPYLSPKARFYVVQLEAYKSYDFMLARIEGLVRGVYTGNVGGDFVDIMGALIRGQMDDAYRQAWNDEGFQGALPDYLVNSLDAFVIKQANFDWIYQYYKNIIDARVDNTSIDPLLSRASLWANRWNEAYNEAIRIITLNNGGNLEWTLGATEEHCPECAAFNGIVARASEWETLGIRPQNAPNNKLTCGGWKCDCSLTPTDKKRSPNAYGRLEEILLGR